MSTDLPPFAGTPVDRSRAEQFEPLGSKPKFWYRDGDKRLLFKADDRGTGEDWAEVIVCELCKLIGLPHVHYDLAVSYDGDQELLPGVVCENMAAPPSSLVLGNQLLLALDPSYPKEQRFHVRQHTVESVWDAIAYLQPVQPKWGTNQPTSVESAGDTFVGYVLLDAWTSNQDRHHENWGALVDTCYHLAPTFDHGASLARNLTDEEKKARLSTKDEGYSIAFFAKRAKSAFYGAETQKKALTTLDAALGFGAHANAAGKAWLERILDVSRDKLCGIIHRVPKNRLSDVGREFTLALLLENQRHLKETFSS